MGIIPLTFLFLESQLLITQGLVIQCDDDPCLMSMKMVHVSYIYIYIIHEIQPLLGWQRKNIERKDTNK